jgi:hypothetical protein
LLPSQEKIEGQTVVAKWKTRLLKLHTQDEVEGQVAVVVAGQLGPLEAEEAGDDRVLQQVAMLLGASHVPVHAATILIY